MKNSTRPLDTIKADIDTALKNRTANAIRLGGLLCEAKAHVRHGEFEVWLTANFPLSGRTARNYMSAFEFAERCGISETVSVLKLPARTIYAMAAATEGYFTPAGIDAILKAAEVEWIDEDRAREIQLNVTKAEEAARIAAEVEPTRTELGSVAAEMAKIEAQLRADSEAKFAAAEEARAEAEAILDGPPPELPSTVTPLRSPAEESLVSNFESAMAELGRLSTKSRHQFLGSKVTSNDIIKVVDFLNHLEHVLTREKAA